VSRSPGSRLLLAGLLVAVFLSFLPALRGAFLWDDADYVVRNDSIRSLDPASLAALLETVQVGNYHPLTMLSLAIDHALFGLDPFGYHLVSVLLHLLNVFLVHRLVLDLSRRFDAAILAAAFWGLHPLRVESVAWVSGRKDLLYTAFFLVALLAYRRWTRHGDLRSYAASLGAYLLSLLSKGMAVSLALVLPASDFLDGRKLTRRAVLDKLPFLALSLAFGCVAIWAQRTSGALDGETGRSLLVRCMVGAYGLVAYLGKTVAPVRLSALYPYPTAPGEALPLAFVLVALSLVPLAALVAWSLRRTRKVAFAALFYVATAILVLQILPVGGAMMADRYTYLPGVALSYLAAEGAVALRDRGGAARGICGAGAVVALALLSVLTFRQCGIWRDHGTLWNDVVRKQPHAHVAWRILGLHDAAEGRKLQALRNFDEAIRLRPDYAEAYNGRANMRADLGDRAGAARDYETLIRLRPDLVLGHYGLAYLAGEMGDFRTAAEGFTRVLEIDPRMLEARLNRGEAFLRIGRFEDARRDFDAAIDQAPRSAVAYGGRARARLALGDEQGARDDMAKAASLETPAP
jgi:tetratricopeptide (TPR) repeat protein